MRGVWSPTVSMGMSFGCPGSWWQESVVLESRSKPRERFGRVFRCARIALGFFALARGSRGFSAAAPAAQHHLVLADVEAQAARGFLRALDAQRRPGQVVDRAAVLVDDVVVRLDAAVEHHAAFGDRE